MSGDWILDNVKVEMGYRAEQLRKANTSRVESRTPHWLRALRRSAAVEVSNGSHR